MTPDKSKLLDLAEVTVIGSETTLQFIERLGPGGALTCDVAGRFGWDMKRARRELQKLEDAGALESCYEHQYKTAWCGGNAAPGRQICWRISASLRARAAMGEK